MHRKTPYDAIVADLSDAKLPSEFTRHMVDVMREIIKDFFQDHNEMIDFRRKLDDDEYSELLKWALINGKDASVDALLSSDVFTNYQEILKKILISAFNNNDLILFSLLLKKSQYLRDILPTTRKTLSAEFGMNGATILHLAAYKGRMDFCQAILDIVPDMKDSRDYHGNNLLHYAAVRNINACYDNLNMIYTDLEMKKNLFGHLPGQYLNSGYLNFNNISQYVLINKFSEYIKIISHDNDQQSRDAFIKEIKAGLCYGIAFVSALHSLRGEEARAGYTYMQEAVSNWDGSQNALEGKIDDPYLQSLGLFTLTNVINYLFNLFQYFFVAQNESSVFNLSKSDRASQLAAVNSGKDYVSDITNYARVGMSKEDCKDILLLHLQPNTIICVNAPVDHAHFLTHGLAGHAMSIAVDADEKLFFCDPSFMFTPLPLTKDDINIIVDLLYDRLNPASIHIYSYTPDKQLKMRQGSVKPALDYQQFLVSKNSNTQSLITQAINYDSPHMLIACLNSLKSPLAKEFVIEGINKAIDSRSYSCASVLLDYASININALNLDEKREKEFLNYLHNTLKP